MENSTSTASSSRSPTRGDSLRRAGRTPRHTGSAPKGWQCSNYSVVSDRTGGAPWCHATGKTAGEAWLQVARQMVEYDVRIAAEKQALAAVCAALASAESPADREVAALRYAAVRIEQSSASSSDRDHWSSAWRGMAGHGGAWRGMAEAL